MNSKGNEYFTAEEMKEAGITDYKYQGCGDKPFAYKGDEISIWDYRENHNRFASVVAAKKEGKTVVFYPFLPMFITEQISYKDNLNK